jgi:restriction endonuclease Mrr
MNPRRHMISPQRHGAPPLNLTLDDLNREERRVHEVLQLAAEPLKIREIARRTFKLRPNTYVADYRTRNALRRLVREHIVEQVDRGKYQASSTGTSRTRETPEPEQVKNRSAA